MASNRNFNGNCPYCGGVQRRRNSRNNNTNVNFQPTTAAIAAPNTCEGQSTAQQLYTSSVPAREEIAICCDELNGRQTYRAQGRDAYWPFFAHPRWLSCDELYGRQNRISNPLPDRNR